jgi:hypothetical protein
MAKSTSKDAVPAHFSGHETFPLRQMWLKKAFDQSRADWQIPKSTFTDEAAIAEFGVGKNMVASIKHWALACDLMRTSDDGSGNYVVTELARDIFDDEGLDPYSESPTTAWLAHWRLAGLGSRATTWYWLFNRVSLPTFSRDELEGPLADFALELDPKKRRLSPSTISRDIETCLRSYAPRSTGGSPEDYAEPMLGELGLIGEQRKGHFSFRRGPKVTLSDGMFAFALLDYWPKAALSLSSMAFETVAYGDGSPGRVFKLDEDSVAERLVTLEEITSGALSWTDTAGLRQVHRRNFDETAMSRALLARAYD